jgi:hypothetical protein
LTPFKVSAVAGIVWDALLRRELTGNSSLHKNVQSVHRKSKCRIAIAPALESDIKPLKGATATQSGTGV